MRFTVNNLNLPPRLVGGNRFTRFNSCLIRDSLLPTLFWTIDWDVLITSISDTQLGAGDNFTVTSPVVVTTTTLVSTPVDILPDVILDTLVASDVLVLGLNTYLDLLKSGSLPVSDSLDEYSLSSDFDVYLIETSQLTDVSSDSVAIFKVIKVNRDNLNSGFVTTYLSNPVNTNGIAIVIINTNVNE